MITPRMFSLGHSTHSLDEFVGLLARHGVAMLADIRRFPGSRRYPHFNQAELLDSLPAANVEYRWFETLGGRRGKSSSAASPNLGLRNESFRNYADYMQTPEFAAAVDDLLQVADGRPAALMCSEGLFWRCHRRLVSDFLLGRDIPVTHIMPSGALQPHSLTAGARLVAGVPTYPPADDDQRRLPL